MSGLTTKTSAEQIDDLYPVAGQDNNSQGFRDNFSYIKTGLVDAGESIAALETNSAKLNVDNNFNGVLIENAITKRVYGTVYSPEAIPALNSSSLDADIRNGDYHVYPVQNNATITLRQWPADGKYAKVTLDFTSTSSSESRSITLTAPGGATFKMTDSSEFLTRLSASSIGFTLPASSQGSVVIEAWTYNQGSTVYVKYVGLFV